MAFWKKSAALAAIALAVVLPTAPAAADDYVNGKPPCIPGNPSSGSGVDSDKDGTPDECDSWERCVPGIPDSGSGNDSDGDGTPDECDVCPDMPGDEDGGNGDDDGDEDTNDNGIVDACEGETGGSVKPGGSEKPGEATTGGAGTAQPGGGSGGPTGAGAPSGSLPVTGGDVVGLTLIGVFAVGTGAVLVRRSRRGGASTTTA